MKITDHTRAIELYLSGLSLSKVAELVGCSPVWVRQILLNRGHQTRGYHSVRPRTVEHKNAIELYSAGLSLKEVGRRVGCSANWVRKILKQNGYETRSYTAARTCRVCGEPADKQMQKGSLYGARCRKHRLEAKRRALLKFRLAHPDSRRVKR